MPSCATPTFSAQLLGQTEKAANVGVAELLHERNEQGAQVTLTDAGQQLHTQIHTAVGQVTQRLWGDLPTEDLATAGRVLSTILARANAELASGCVM